MIYTVTFDPILERAVEIDELIYDDVNIAASEKRYVSAKGIDVSRVIKELGGQSVATGLIGGYNGKEIEDRLNAEGISCDFAKVNAESASRIIILQKRKKLRTVVEVPSYNMGLDKAEYLGRKLAEIPAGSIVVMSVTPKELPNKPHYADLIRTFNEKNIRVILDADAEDLRQGIEAGPYLVKPNIHEFGRLIGRNVTDFGEIIRSAEPFLTTVAYIVVSMGAKGVIGVSKEGNFLVVPPKINVRCSFGAGDCLIAGITQALHENATFRDALVLGVACGAASALNPENVICKAEDVHRISGSVRTEEIKKN